MQETKHTEERDALREGRVVLCHDHDGKRLERLLNGGGRVVGWVDGKYRVLMGERHG